MTSSPNQYLLWVTRDDAGALDYEVLLERVEPKDRGVEVRTEALGRWGMARIPAGSRDEWGTVLPDVLNVGYNELPPEGRLYVVGGSGS